jgi:hypothetical protein
MGNPETGALVGGDVVAGGCVVVDTTVVVVREAVVVGGREEVGGCTVVVDDESVPGVEQPTTASATAMKRPRCIPDRLRRRLLGRHPQGRLPSSCPPVTEVTIPRFDRHQSTNRVRPSRRSHVTRSDHLIASNNAHFAECTRSALPERDTGIGIVVGPSR